MKKIALLGSTGSIGVNTLKIAKEFGLEVEVLVAGNNTKLLQRQVAEFKPRIVVSAKGGDFDAPVVLRGEEGILEALEVAESDLVVNALVGFVGVAPTLKAIELGKRVALANKESLVVAGKFIDTSAITPIDSEHFALWYILQSRFAPKRLIITASGGALRDWPLERLQSATLEDVLRHPNWSMGQKITIDSATMVNKLFEILEGYWLFGTKNIDAVIEANSKIHAVVEFVDGSAMLHASSADMRLPIAFALLGRVEKEIVKPLDLLQLHCAFKAIDPKRYPVWQLKKALLENPQRGVVVNAANEAAIERFLAGSFGFLDIAKAIIKAWKAFEVDPRNVDEIFAIDKEVRRYVKAL